MKKSAEVAAAEAAEAAAKAAWERAEAAEKEASEAHTAAMIATREARRKADGRLPQCNLVRVSWHSQKIVHAEPVAIVRKTKSGQIVVRRLGDAEDFGRFQHQNGGWFHVNKSSWVGDKWKLRDVPAEFDAPEVTP